jgi:hypothetical protein
VEVRFAVWTGDARHAKPFRRMQDRSDRLCWSGASKSGLPDFVQNVSKLATVDFDGPLTAIAAYFGIQPITAVLRHHALN